MEGERVKIPARAFQISAALFLVLLISQGPALAVEPGVDIAAPRVAISLVTDVIGFQPANLVVEQGDYVRWHSTAVTLPHTTTSGPPCVTNGLWGASLGPGAIFTRQFLESPQALLYFCSFHCGMGMRGQVTVTSPIVLQAANKAGNLDLSWTGGGGLYQVNRSDGPGFVSAGTIVLAPAGGDAGITFSDALQPGVGGVLYYLITNKF
jgi:plastocyanin